tara:strand:- start:3633 stop:4208 length:576 start_codon:yes stop_codon:yes gene_type:complete
VSKGKLKLEEKEGIYFARVQISKIVCFNESIVNVSELKYCMMNSKINGYNVRVYGILINAATEVLLSSETRGDFSFTKFPGGGHQLGEGLSDCLKREFKEELGIDIEIKVHFYTTDFFQVSQFDETDQLLSIYYIVSTDEMDLIENGRVANDASEKNPNHFYWRKIDELQSSELTFPIDRIVLKKLQLINR